MKNDPLKHITLPVVDLSNQTGRHVFVARGNQIEWNGHPSTVLLPDGRTIFCVWQARRDGTRKHGAPGGFMKRSDDGGHTWSDDLDLPATWREIGRGSPTIHRLSDGHGKARLFVFCRDENRTTFLVGTSEDNGATWSELRPIGLAEPEAGPITGWTAPITILEATAPDGRRRHLMWYERTRDGQPSSGVIWQSASYDGGLTWGESRPVVDKAGSCEPACVRSPDGKQLLLLIREQNREMNSLMATSDDEGETWTTPRELLLALTGDRHLPRYAPDGRLVIVFRPVPPGEAKTLSAFPDGYFTAWVGRYEDIVAGREGECLIRLLRSHRGADHTYPGLEVLPDGTFVATTYIQYQPDELQSIVSVRFRLEDIQPASRPGDAQLPDWAREQIALRRTLEEWIDIEMDRYEAHGFEALYGARGGHSLDEAGGHTRSFVSAYCLNGNDRIVRFMKRFRDDWLAAVDRAGHVYHGYDANETGDYVTHTAEAFTQFLLNVLYLDIGDSTSVPVIEDAAEHLGNWHPDVQDFYDWERHAFLSYFPGTRSPYHRPPFNHQSFSHFRLLPIATAAYEATGRARYLDLCRDYWTFWERVFENTPPDQPVPMDVKLIDADEIRRYASQPEIMADWRFHRYYARELADMGLGEGPKLNPQRLPDAFHRYHDPVMTLLDLLRFVPGDRSLCEGLRRLMGDWIAVCGDRNQMLGLGSVGSLYKLGDVWCGVHLPKYRAITGDTSFDAAYLECWPLGPCAYLLDGDPRRLTGVAAAAESSLRQTLARNRGDFGSAFVNTHSCDRESNASAATAVMPALFSVALGGLGVHFGRAPWLSVRYFTDGKPGLPADVAARYVPATAFRAAGVQLVNLGNTPYTVGLKHVDPGTATGLVLTDPMPPDALCVTLEPETCHDVTFAGCPLNKSQFSKE